MLCCVYKSYCKTLTVSSSAAVDQFRFTKLAAKAVYSFLRMGGCGMTLGPTYSLVKAGCKPQPEFICCSLWKRAWAASSGSATSAVMLAGHWCLHRTSKEATTTCLDVFSKISSEANVLFQGEVSDSKNLIECLCNSFFVHSRKEDFVVF